MRHRSLLLLVIALCLSACSLVDMRLRTYGKQVARVGFQQHVYEGPTGRHAVWSQLRGDRPVVVLLHGITAEGLAQWKGTALALSATYDVVVPDLLGHGATTATWSGSAIDAQVAHVLLLLDSLGVQQPVYLVGSSYGGVVAALFAEQHPARTKVLVVNDGPVSDYDVPTADSIARWAGAADIKDLLLADTPREQRRIMQLVMYDPPWLPGFALRQYNKRFIIPRKGELTMLLDDLMGRSDRFTAHTYDWAMPAYLIWGSEDRLIPMATANGILQRQHVPVDRSFAIEKAGHVPNLERPEAFMNALLSILESDTSAIRP